MRIRATYWLRTTLTGRRARAAYWQALDEAINERDGTDRVQALVGELDRAGYTTAARCLADDLDALLVRLPRTLGGRGSNGARRQVASC
jgi:hypothetical protein